MNPADLPPELATPPAGLIAAVRAIAQGPLADAAEAIDRGSYPRHILQALGAAGAFSAHLGPGTAAGDFAAAIRASAAVSQVCGATGFMMWCQAVCGLYMQASGNPALTAAPLLDLERVAFDQLPRGV